MTKRHFENSMGRPVVRDRGDMRGTAEYECLIIGAGICGLYQLHRLVDLGVSVLAVDANADVGGTWFNNRYPGCRFDSESFTYGYSWSPEVLAEWTWKERFAPQTETLRYLSFVADKYALRRHIRFSTRVASAEWDESSWLWRVVFDSGESVTARYILTAMGMLSIPTKPRIEGIDTFEGTALHTFDWPDGLDYRGKRVAVIGTGSTGVQVISTIAAEVDELVVFQLDASWCVPLHNSPIDPGAMDRIRATYDEIFQRCKESPSGFMYRPDRRRTKDVSRQERLDFWEKLYGEPGFGIWLGNFRDVLMDEDANRKLSDFVAGKIRARIHDPLVAETLIPKDHGFGTKRVPLETGYYETYNRDNVELVDLHKTPIERITPRGVLVRDDSVEREYPFDLIVFATGFDAVTGAFDRIDFRGAGGVSLREKWSQGPETLLGIATAGFPNLLMVGGPQSGSVASNFPRGIEDAVDWATEFIADVTARGVARFEAGRDAELRWVEYVEEFHSTMLMSRTKSWFNGHNINLDREVPKRPLVYSGGAVRYRRRLQEEAEAGYPSFVISSGRSADLAG
jgi:cation diffusion facilitator CzcD-associated flavoprotein CzcO